MKITHTNITLTTTFLQKQSNFNIIDRVDRPVLNFSGVLNYAELDWDRLELAGIGESRLE